MCKKASVSVLMRLYYNANGNEKKITQKTKTELGLIKRLTDSTADITSGETDTTNGQTSTTSGKMSTTSG